MRKILFLGILLLLGTTSLIAGPRRRPIGPFPPCRIVNGTPAVTFTRDDGRTLMPLAETLEGVGYTFGLAALDVPGTLLSLHKLTLSISTDDGCNWRPVATLPEAPFPPSIAAAPGGRAYVWSDNRQFFARYDNLALEMLKPPGQIIGIGIDEHDARHLRVGTSDGTIWDSADGGSTWNVVGRKILTLPLIYRFAFDPHDLNHVLCGASEVGASVSRDGGRNWTSSNIGDGFNVFNVAFSPADSEVVWAMGLELALADVGPSHGRSIYRSTDGGTTFHAVVDQTDQVTLINGPLLAPHPRDPNVLYFVFGTSFASYGTDLFRYDDASRTLRVAHNQYDGIHAIAFSRTDSRILYLGLAVEDIH